MATRWCRLSNPRGFQDLLAHKGPVDSRQARDRTIPAERDGLAQGCNEDLAVGTSAQVSTNFLANISCELIIDIGGQLTENAQASALAMVMLMPNRRSACSLSGSVALGHETVSSAIQVERVRDQVRPGRALGHSVDDGQTAGRGADVISPLVHSSP